MGWISIDILCELCNTKWWDTVDRAATEGPHLCPSCGEKAGRRTVSAPRVLQIAYHDGHRRGGGYQEMKEAAKLEKAAMNVPPSERRGIYREIAKLKATKKEI